MKPSLTSHLARSILKHLGSDLRVDENGLPMGEVFVDFEKDTDDVRRDYLAYNLLRKREVKDGDSLRAIAIKGFIETERRCHQIEETGSITANLDWLARWALLSARGIMHRVLGNVPSDWYRECVFTGGASTSRNRQSSHPATKWWAIPSLDVTYLALPHLSALKASCEVLDTYWDDPGVLSGASSSLPWYRVVPGSRLETVEKTYKTDRVIMIEPDGNMLLQKGVGNIIRRRLKAEGIDLNDQTRNQRLAYAGSCNGSLGTIDLSSASDSITLSLLRLLLPSDWYDLVFELRSPYYLLDGVWTKMTKCSSMGNGFTFELESAVFYALSKAVVELLKPTDRRVAVYGDDIIVASSVCGALESVLNRCGFLLNREKSFWKGGFRESCGKHYHFGADVTPVYLKADLDCISERFRLYNQLRYWTGGVHNDPRYTPMLNAILATIPKRDRVQVPVEYGDNTGLHFEDVATHRVIKRRINSVIQISFVAYTRSQIDLTPLLESECAWLYRHTERWEPSCPLGLKTYEPLSVVRQGELERTRIHACSLM